MAHGEKMYGAFIRLMRETLDEMKDRVISSLMIYGISVTCFKWFLTSKNIPKPFKLQVKSAATIVELFLSF